MNFLTRQKWVVLLLTMAAALVVALPGSAYAQFGGLANMAKTKAAEALTGKVMKELEKKFADKVAKEPISEAAKADIVQRLSDMARPIVKKVVDAGMSGSLPNPVELVNTVLNDVLPKVPGLVAAARGGGGGAVAGAAAPPPAQQAAPAAAVAPPAQQPAAPVQEPEPNKPKIAAYAFGAADSAVNKAMAVRLLVALDNGGRYQAAENYKEFFEQASKAQNAGTARVNSDQLKKLGEEFGAEYVCVAEITTVFGEKQVSAHILAVKYAGIAAIGAADMPLRTLADLTAASEQLAASMFGNAPKLTSFGTLSDARDGKTYKTVNIGGMAWMAENLNYETPNGSWCYHGNANGSENCVKYGGRLYDWNVAKGACPAGWRLPSRQEWDNMVAAAGGSTIAGKKLKATAGWGGGNGTNDYGFSASPGGYRVNNGSFGNAGNGGNWWTSAENGNSYAYCRRMSSYDDSVDETYNYKEYGFSVRCVGE
jgi:uncharacterized protein (TIGR02145 family)